MIFAIVVLVLLLIALIATIVSPTAVPAAVLLVLSAVWLPANHKLEGSVLFVLSYTHGVTLSDLLAVLGAIVGAGVLMRVMWFESDPRDRTWNLVTVAGACWSVIAIGALVAVAGS
jgi:hypothetical protein